MRLESLKLVFATGIESVTKGQWDVKKLNVPVTAAIIRFNHNLVSVLHCVVYRNLSGQSPHFVSLNMPFLLKGTKKVSFTSFIQ